MASIDPIPRSVSQSTHVDLADPCQPRLGAAWLRSAGVAGDLVSASRSSSLAAPQLLVTLSEEPTQFERRILAESREHPETLNWRIVRWLRFEGELDREFLAASVAWVFRRHMRVRGLKPKGPTDTLRFATAAPELRVLGHDLKVPESWGGDFPSAEASYEAAAAPSASGDEGLFEAVLCRLDATTHFLRLAGHPLAVDAPSLAVLGQEIVTAYARLRAGESLEGSREVPDRGSVSTGPAGELSDLEFWKEMFEGFSASLQLPIRGVYRRLELHPVRRLEITLDPLSVPSLVRLYGADPQRRHAALLTALGLLLCRYSDQEQVALGVLTSGRGDPARSQPVGPLERLLPLRLDLNRRLTFRQTVDYVSQQVMRLGAKRLDSIDHAWTELGWASSGEPSGFGRVAFGLLEPEGPLAAFEGLKVSDAAGVTSVNPSELTLRSAFGSEQPRFTLEFSTLLYSEDVACEFVDRLQRLLGSALQQPDQAVDSLDWMEHSERELVLQTWNNTARPYPREGTITGQFDAIVRQYGSQPAVSWKGDRLSYAELKGRADQLAAHLQGQGVRVGDRVGVWMDRSLDMVVALLGILKAGGAYVPLDPSYPAERLRWMLQDAGLTVVLTQAALAEGIPDLPGLRLIRMDSDWTDISRRGAAAVASGATAETPAYVIYTSGSTGVPKGSVVPHRAVLRLVCGADYVVLGPQTIALQLAPVSFDASTLELWGPLLNGGCCALFPGRVPTSVDLGKALVAHRVNLLWLTSSLYNAIIDEAPEVLQGIEQLLIGGEALSLPHVRRGLEHLPQTRIINGYGPTEGTTFTCCYAIPPDLDSRLTSVPIGRPISNTRVYILDRRREPVPPGVWGELYIGGDGLAVGYLNRPELTAEKFVPDPFSSEGSARLYRSGDVCRYLPDGLIEFRGRVDDQVKVRGFRIELGEIEAALRRCAGVKDCTVMVRTDAGDKRIVAYLVPERGSRSDAATSVGEERTAHWKRQYDEVLYASTRQAEGDDDPRYNFAGWMSNYTGLPLSDDEMLEQLDQTIARATAMSPQSVLEIGCGTGLLLFRLASSCQRYVATDFSEVALDYVRNHLAREDLRQVQLLRVIADDFSQYGEGRFDLVLLNSVVQYFSDVGYLARVLESAVAVTAPGGCVMVGDVRNLRMMRSLHTSIQAFQAPSSLPLEQLRQRVEKHLELDAELAVDPEFFFALAQGIPRVSRVEVRPKRGQLHNEFTRFRYDVILHVDREVANPSPCRSLQWGVEVRSLDELRSLLQGWEGGGVRVQRIPNARTAEERLMMERMDGGSATESVGEARKVIRNQAGGVDPEDCLSVAEGLHGWQAALDWSHCDEHGTFDLELTLGPVLQGIRGSASPPERSGGVATQDFSRFANDPLRAATTRKLVPEVRSWLESRLPEYMVPSAFVVLEKLPVTANGKVDRAALPAPSLDRPELTTPYAPPSTPTQEAIVALWQKVLGLKLVGVDDNFFSLGGDSIQAMLIISTIQKKLGEVVHVIVLFDAPTVAELSAYLDQHYANVAARLKDRASAVDRTEAVTAKPAGGGQITPAEVAHVRSIISPVSLRAPDRSGKNSRAVFILCPPRSGSTLLRVLLAGNPDLFAPPELELLGFDTLKDRRLAHQGKTDFLLEGSIRALMELMGCDADAARRRETECEASGMTTKQFYAFLQGLLGRRMLVDKTPTYSLDLETLRRAEQDFAEPLYIHLARHPYGMIRSFEEAKMDQVFFRYEHSYNLRQLGELMWIVSQQNILHFLETIPGSRRLLVRFEELVTAQQPVVESICRFLGLDFHPGMLRPYEDKKSRMTDGTHPLARGLVDVKFNTHRAINPAVAELWKQEYRDEFLSDVSWELAERLGYPRSSASQPPP